mgnify:CR=1 FL=1
MKKWDFLNESKSLTLLIKRLRRYYRNEMSYSVTLPKWSKKQRNLLLANNYFPNTNNFIVNLVITLERHFNYPREQAIKQAVKINTLKRKEIHGYMRKWFNYGRPNQRIKIIKRSRALKEQLARGFVPRGEFKINPELPYIHSNIQPLVWPKQWKFKDKGLNDHYKRLTQIGVSGHTGITLPKRLYGK